jgi:hypothetical protein
MADSTSVLNMKTQPPAQAAAPLQRARRIARFAPAIISAISTIVAAALVVATMFIHGQMPTTTDGPGGLAVVLFEWPVALAAALTCVLALGAAMVAFRSNPILSVAALVVDVGIAFLLLGYATNSPTWQHAAYYFSAEHQWETRKHEAVDYRAFRIRQLDQGLKSGSRFSLQVGPGAHVRFLGGGAQAVGLDGNLSASNTGSVHADLSLDARILDSAAASAGQAAGESTLGFELRAVLDEQMRTDVSVPIRQDFGGGLVREVHTEVHVEWHAAAEDHQLSLSFRMPATSNGDGLPARRASTYTITVVPTRVPKSTLDQWK